MSNKWLKQLQKHGGYVEHSYDAFAEENCIYSPSPYLNSIFGNKSHGVPHGAGILLFSEPKAGKSLICQSFVEELHRRDPTAMAICYNTEMKGKFQKGLFKGIDPDRYVIYDTNRPGEIFDHLAYDIKPMVQDGMPLKLVIIDSITQTGGVKAEGKSVEDHLIGDKALTLTRGYDMIIPFLKQNNINYISVAQIRANIGVMHGPDIKAAVPKAAEHNHEYWISVRRATAADDKKDLSGNSFEDEGVKDARGNKQLTGHKIYVKMEDSSFGAKGRTAKFTVDYNLGIVNKHEEIFELGVNFGVIERPNNVTYQFGDLAWRGKNAAAEAIRDNEELANIILKRVKEIDAK